MIKCQCDEHYPNFCDRESHFLVERKNSSSDFVEFLPVCEYCNLSTDAVIARLTEHDKPTSQNQD